MNERKQSHCRLCHQFAEVRNIDLYVFGSEGLNACLLCELKLVEFAAGLSREAGRLRIEVEKAKRREYVANRINNLQDEKG